MKSMISFTLSLFLTSCMHLGMMGTHEENESGEHETAPESVLEKEVEFGDVKATAIFPPLQVGKETVFSLKLVDKKTGQPVSDAKVSFHTSSLHAAEKSDMGMMHDESGLSQAQSPMDHDVNFDQEVNESSRSGVYSASLTPSRVGEHKTMFHIAAVGEKQLEGEVIIETTRHASPSGKTQGGKTHGTGGAPEYAIIGVAVMSVVMIAMWAAGGRMF